VGQERGQVVNGRPAMDRHISHEPAVHVADPDGHTPRADLVILQFLHEPFQIADQPGPEDDRPVARLAEATPTGQDLVQGPLRMERQDALAPEFPPEGFTRRRQEFTDERGLAVVYMICEPSEHYYHVMTGSQRMPVFIDQRI
jgi:hypothetical protein